MRKKLILKINKPDFVVKLYEDTLEVDLKRGIKKKIEGAAESGKIVRETLGRLVEPFIPLDVSLEDIETTDIDEKGHLKIITPLRKDLVIRLTAKESERLQDKLEELIPLAKQREADTMKALREYERRPKVPPPTGEQL